MTSEEFNKLVDRIEAKYRSRPLALRVRIAFLLGLGYSGFFTILLGVLILAAGMALGAAFAESAPSIFLVAGVAILLAFGFCQALIVLWVPLEAEKGRELTRDEVPELFHLLDRLASDLNARPFHHVRIKPDFNSYVQMIPMLGVFGLNRRYLYLGLPMMQTLSAEQFAAVLAHEFAHCSSRHDRFGMWIYRLRNNWSRIFSELHSGNSNNSLKSFRSMVLKFIDWYWPRFNAYAFVLSRQNEYEADRTAAEWGGVASTADALFRIECFGIRLNEQFWKSLTDAAKAEDTVPDDFIDRMTRFFATAPLPADAERWLNQAKRMLTGNSDTHPSLSDRLKALNQDFDRLVRTGFPILPAKSAAQYYLADALPQITRDVGLEWQKENTLRWQSVFHNARRLERQYQSVVPPVVIPQESVEATATTVSLVQEDTVDVERLWEQAKALCELRGTSAAEPILRQVLMHSPSHALANVTLGGHLVDLSQPEGEELLRRVLAEEDSDMIPHACHKLVAYYQQLGQPDRVQAMLSELTRFEEAQIAAAKERNAVSASDKFLPHELSDDERLNLETCLEEQVDLYAAWLVRKDLTHFPKRKLFVLVVRTRPRGLFGGSDADEDRRLVSRLISKVKLPGRVLVISPQGGFRSLARKIMSRSEASVFPVVRSGDR